jgi:hypothetical protein
MDCSEYHVVFSNLTGCAVGVSEILWSTKVQATSEDEALRLAMAEATKLNATLGMPPHGLHVSPSCLESLAYVSRAE